MTITKSKRLNKIEAEPKNNTISMFEHEDFYENGEYIGQTKPVRKILNVDDNPNWWTSTVIDEETGNEITKEYATGEKARYSNKNWVSLVDNNTSVPSESSTDWELLPELTSNQIISESARKIVRESTKGDVATRNLTQAEVDDLSETFPQWKSWIDVEVGDILGFNGKLVEAEQAHTTQPDWDPDTATNLWNEVVLPTSGTPEWRSNVAVEKGQTYTYNSSDYTVIQSHTTQTGWEPDVTPALWEVVTESGGTNEWQTGISVEVGEVYTYNSTEYEVIQAHTTQEGWEPPDSPSLWDEVTE